MEKTVKIAGHEIEVRRQKNGALPKSDVAAMLEAFRSYRNAKERQDRNVIENEDWFRGNHWRYISGKTVQDYDFRPAGAYLFNGIWHRHAEAMENYPQPVLLEREPSDRARAEQLSKIVPLILQKNHFSQVYSDIWWYKLKQGSGIYGVFWDKSLESGLGDVSIKKIDLLRFYCQPYLDDIQDSRYIFLLSLCDAQEAHRRYPDAQLKSNGQELSVKSYFGTRDTENKVCIIDCYERVRQESGKTVVHLTKIIGEKAVYSTKTDPRFAQRGLYDHGMYPFVVDTLVPVEGSPFGLGTIDIGKNAQAQIDKLEYLIERNALISARQRFLVKRDGGIDPKKLSDLSVDFIECDRNVDDSSVRPLQATPLTAPIISCRENKIEELKEIIGNRDFSQGATAQGVTAYAAISALQQAGSRLSRDSIEASYRAFSQVIYMVIELIAQFYTEQRSFRIMGEDGRVSYLAFGGEGGALSAAVFDIEVSAQKKNVFNTAAHNELILELYRQGAFEPSRRDATIAALNAMILDNKQSIIRSLHGEQES